MRFRNFLFILFSSSFSPEQTASPKGRGGKEQEGCLLLFANLDQIHEMQSNQRRRHEKVSFPSSSCADNGGFQLQMLPLDKAAAAKAHTQQ